MSKKKAAEKVETNDVMPELTGFGIHPAEGPGNLWLAFRFTNYGDVEILTPPRNGKHVGERKPTATGRMMAAQRIQLHQAKR